MTDILSDDGGNWESISPCPICGHTTWCRQLDTGRLTECMRVSQGSLGQRENVNGETCYYHRGPDFVERERDDWRPPTRPKCLPEPTPQGEPAHDAPPDGQPANANRPCRTREDIDAVYRDLFRAMKYPDEAQAKEDLPKKRG